MNDASPPREPELAITDLPTVLTQIFERAQRPLLPQAQGSLGLFVRYLRRKAERGLAVIYAVDELHPTHKGRSNDPSHTVSLTLDEQALEGVHIRFSAAQAQQAELDILPSGVLHLTELGLAVQHFPADSSLPALAECCDTSPQSTLCAALAAAAQQQIGNSWQLVGASAEPVRYKPGNRCVIRYRLQLEQASTEIDNKQKTLTLFGKVYNNPEQARDVQSLQQQLYDEQKEAGVIPLLPQPLGMLDTLGLTFNEAVQVNDAERQSNDRWSQLRTGTHTLQPRVKLERSGAITQITIPVEELQLAAQALARLHNSHVQPLAKGPRTGSKEAKRAQERASLLAQRNQAQAAHIEWCAQQLASRLESLQPDRYRPAHGGFKASQLLFHSHRVYVVDFDGFCLADPALDVGYFLAYLRPSALWYRRSGMRQWFEEAATIFRNTYQQEMVARGVTLEAVQGILERTRLYEAALLFKIATRRINRLNSPRPQELSNMLNEITQCLK
ncbi:MAG TPA: phosphotransferase [Ktedonobacteraceae bacterium]|nr:phosphotransferase [Ktedonobacteraceae bacterium]